jgi:hypothetical protein
MIVDKTYKGLRFAKRQIVCRRGNARMRCGTCGGMDFEIHVMPNQDGSAKVDELVCLGCLKHRRVMPDSRLENTGTLKLTDPDYATPTPTDIRAREIRKANE